jgi:hypothetical protein
MEDREAAFRFLGSMPTELIERADSGLRREEFEKSVRDYLREQDFQDDKVSPRLLGALFKATSLFLKRKSVLPRMLTIVNSRDWNQRAKLMIRLSTVDIPRMRRKLIQKAHKSKAPRSRAVVLWTLRQLKTMSNTLWFAFKVQKMEFHAVRGLATPPIDSQFLYDLRELLRSRMKRTSVAKIDVLIAACAVAANIFSSEDAASDVVSRIPMRISRATKTISRQQAESAAHSWLGPITPARRTPSIRLKSSNAGSGAH